MVELPGVFLVQFREALSDVLFNRRGEDFFHRRDCTPGNGLLVHPGIGPERMRNAAVRRDARVIALLVAVVDGAARQNPIAVVPAPGCRWYPSVGTESVT